MPHENTCWSGAHHYGPPLPSVNSKAISYLLISYIFRPALLENPEPAEAIKGIKLWSGISSRSPHTGVFTRAK